MTQPAPQNWPLTIRTEQVPIKLWLDDIEEGALEQARHLANLPFAFHHVAIMPDAHLGYGMPIGGVMATEGVVVPNAVGVDIGCGMCACRSSLSEVAVSDLKRIMSLVREAVPLGFAHHKRRQDPAHMPQLEEDEALPQVHSEYGSALCQLGTLGGGNHFIEIQQAVDHRIWIMIHSGSRNLGFRVAHHYNDLARRLNLGGQAGVPPAWQLAWLELDSPEGRRYLREMRFCVDFALANRHLMLERIQQAFAHVLGPVDFEPFINIAHNYAAAERHFHREVMVHRKGATSARAGELGIIPGSQGTASYIVRGRGCVESFMSCSHGAGRVMGRKEAQRRLDLAAEQQRLDRQGIVHALRRKSDLDEAAGAYKDIETVLTRQQDLVEVVERLRPLAVIKG
ncbi:MAG: RNA-splicing ligase RtcB [Desulfobulbaceae bacterium A2]|nr:MAG: RNA-splicing ligase RtcB [Desulfobulbaceae bacterium A2]